MGYSVQDKARISAGICIACKAQPVHEALRRCTGCNEANNAKARERTARPGKRKVGATAKRLLEAGRLSYSTVKAMAAG